MTAADTLAVAIVGCGIIGGNHAKAITAHPRLRLAAAVDTVDRARDELATMAESVLGVERPVTAGSLAEVLAGTHVDIVAICTPSGLHVSLAEDAIAAGCHVVIEKPLDVALPRGRRLADLADEAAGNGRVVSVISQHRFDPASVVVSRAIADGSLGRMTSAVASVAWWRSQDYYDSGQWRGTWDLDGGGAVMNQGVHTVDLLVWFLGMPVEISAQTALLAHGEIEVEDVAVATIRFESGALAVLHATTAAFPGMTVRLQVHGSRGSAVIDDDKLAYLHSAGGADAAENQATSAIDALGLGGSDAPDQFMVGHLRQYEDIVAAIENGTEPGVTVEDAVLSLAVVRGIYVSATLGRPVSLAEVLSGAHDDVVARTGGTP